MRRTEVNGRKISGMFLPRNLLAAALVFFIRVIRVIGGSSFVIRGLSFRAAAR
jgi:hypothetical protein